MWFVLIWLCIGVYIGEVVFCDEGNYVGLIINWIVCLCDLVYGG